MVVQILEFMERVLLKIEVGEWRYRVGEYRIICQIQDKEVLVLVLEIGHRSNIYK